MEIPYIFSSEVSDALASGQPIVALECVPGCIGETTDPVKLVRRFGEILRERGVVPAAIAIIDGELRVGLTDAEHDRVARGDSTKRLAVAELPIALARGGTGPLTLGATAFLADHADIRFVAAGCIGGVDNSVTPPVVSADIAQLSDLPVTVVSAGVSASIDVEATFARYHEADVTIVGLGTTDIDRTSIQLDWVVPDARAVAAIMDSRDELELCGAIVVVPPRDSNDTPIAAAEKAVAITADLAVAWSNI